MSNRGNSKNKQLTRIYGTSWWTAEELANYLNLIEERIKSQQEMEQMVQMPQEGETQDVMPEVLG